jgi:hypothetical protein
MGMVPMRLGSIGEPTSMVTRIKRVLRIPVPLKMDVNL